MGSALRLWFYLIIASFLIPSISLGVFSFRPDLFLSVGLGFIFITTGKVAKIPFKIQLMLMLALVITVLMFLSDSIGLSVASNSTRLYFPTEAIQILARVMAFVVFFVVAYRGWFSYIKLHKWLIAFFSISLLWGVLQRMNISLVNTISKNVYAASRMQQLSFGDDGLRVFGTAGNIIAWGGFCVFIFWYVFFKEKRRLVKISLLLLVVANLIFSASRASIIALVVSFIFIQIFRIKWDKKMIWNFVKVILGILILSVTTYLILSSFFGERLEYLIFRFSSTTADMTSSGRGAQLDFFLGMLAEDPVLLFFGLGKPTLDHMGYLEVEPVFLLVAYGILGALLHYYLLLIIFRLAKRVKSFDRNTYMLIVAWISSYMVFSVGFFFFRELVVGLPFWWLSGFLLGNAYRFQKQQLPNQSLTTNNNTTNNNTTNSIYS